VDGDTNGEKMELGGLERATSSVRPSRQEIGLSGG
jgi:hypothetical protein